MTDFPYAFSNPAYSQGACALPLHHLGLIRATGPEARAFLQGQLSNDSSLVSPTQGQLSGYCSPKGRLLAVLTLLQLGVDDFAIILPASLLSSTLKRLRLFVLRSKLALSDAGADLPALGLLGETTPAALATCGFAIPEHDYGCTWHEGAVLLRRPGPVPRFELRAPPAQLEALRQSLALPSATAEDWAQAEILAGTPQVVAETSEHFVPQTINLDSAGGVSFTKGCYPGQEIVARVHYLGRVKQRLRLARADAPLPAGTLLLNADGHSVGEVMAAALHPQLGAVLGLSLNLAHDNAALHTADGQVAVVPMHTAVSNAE